MGEPPFEIGAVQLIIPEATLAIPVTPKTDDGGAEDGVAGVTEDDAEEATELPAPFIATTVNVSDVPPANPVKVADKTLPTVTATPTDGVTLYPVIPEPETGAFQ